MDSSEVVSEVMYRDEDVFLTLSLDDWPTDCIPLFSVELVAAGEGEGVIIHSRVIPHVSGSSDNRQLHLLIPLERPDNARYTASLTTISSERTVTADDAITYSKIMCACVCVCV